MPPPPKILPHIKNKSQLNNPPNKHEDQAQYYIFTGKTLVIIIVRGKKH
jgi:hypothetical protein